MKSKELNKKCWIDVETTGINSRVCGILTLAALVDIEDKIEDELSLKMRPLESDQIFQKALDVNGISEEEYETWPSNTDGFDLLLRIFDYHIDRFDKSDKFVFCAYNAGFDEGFIRELFLRNGNNYFGSYFFWPKIDVQSLVGYAIADGLRLPDYKLVTVARHFGLVIDAHDAMSDILATKEIANILWKGLCQ